jgi:hypothetical protein
MEAGVKRAITDIQFSIPCFTNANLDAVMCAIIVKLMKEIFHIPPKKIF